MGQIRIKAIPRREPDIRMYVAALIALARQLQEADERERDGRSASPSAKDTGADHG